MELAPPVRILVICTGNICRSAVAERALARDLADRGVPAVVTSAGTHGGLPNDADTVAAAAAAGLDLGQHRSRRLTPELIASDGADLVIAMTRGHLREAVTLDPAAWPRAFTLRELARRAAAVGPVGTVDAWRQALAGTRTAAAMLEPSALDDIADPYGAPYRAHQRMVAEVVDLTAAVAANWPTRAPAP